MRRDQASSTAAWVAAARSAGALLPAELQLAQDPYGLRFADGVGGGLARLGLRYPRFGRRLIERPGALGTLVLWMQLRTRAIDDLLRGFAERGGRQVVLLGAGYDCRALRLAEQLGAARVYEVDHPATQAKKRARVPRLSPERVAYVSWDFEREPLSGLRARLASEGLDPARHTFTIWEGVTMYLHLPQIEATLRAVHELGAPDSELAFTYLDRRAIDRPRGDARLTKHIVSGVGEPYRFGWEPAELPGWLKQRSYALCSDRTDRELAGAHWPARYAARFERAERHVALARTLPTSGTAA